MPISATKSLRKVMFLAASAFLAGCGAGSITANLKVSVSGTPNPLVANFTVAIPCSGQVMVEFGPTASYGRSTAWYSAEGNFQQNSILVAGMRASTLYHMRADIQCDGDRLTSGDVTFQTGALPALNFPTLVVTRPNPSLSSTENSGVESIDAIGWNTPALVTDRDGNPIWYYDVGLNNYVFPFKFLQNGHVVLNLVGSGDSRLTEVDLAGNLIRSMDIYALQKKLAAGGFDFVPAGYHHDFLPLPNGHLIVLVDCSKSFTDLPGYPGTIAVVGDALVDLDQNWNPVWGWNSFDHLDINRHLHGLPDWTHSNGLVYSPYDGNILLSVRHQSWILKIDYENGMGTGNIIWHLGYQGDFALTNDGVATEDPSQWFSYQHYPILLEQSGSQTTLGVWDNGNGRVLVPSTGQVCAFAGNNGPACYSRPSIFQVDESSMVANIQWADPLSYFSVWGGSINQLSNGNVEFDLNDPLVPPGPNVGSQIQEVTSDSPPQVVWQMNVMAPKYAYRGFRIPSLYNGVTWQQ